MITNATDFRERLDEFLDRVSNDRDVLHVTRPDGRAVVVMDAEEYESILETLHLMRSPANVRALDEAIADIEAGRVTKRDDF